MLEVAMMLCKMLDIAEQRPERDERVNYTPV